MKSRVGTIVLCVLAYTACARPATPVLDPLRPGVAAGMGVDYLNPRDIIDMINGQFQPGVRQPDFHAGVEFFGAGFIPLSPRWMLKIEYAYLLNSYNIEGTFGPGELTMKEHLPTVYLHYYLIDEGLYNLSGGIGLGYHLGTLGINYGTLVDSYTANGPGGALDLQGNSAISEHLFVHLGGQARWEFLGELRNAAGKSPGINARGGAVTMNSFSVGARIGVSYYF
jgi:hypothetical protein